MSLSLKGTSWSWLSSFSSAQDMLQRSQSSIIFASAGKGPFKSSCLHHACTGVPQHFMEPVLGPLLGSHFVVVPATLSQNFKQCLQTRQVWEPLWRPRPPLWLPLVKRRQADDRVYRVPLQLGRVRHGVATPARMWHKTCWYPCQWNASRSPIFPQIWRFAAQPFEHSSSLLAGLFVSFLFSPRTTLIPKIKPLPVCAANFLLEATRVILRRLFPMQPLTDLPILITAFLFHVGSPGTFAVGSVDVLFWSLQLSQRARSPHLKFIFVSFHLKSPSFPPPGMIPPEAELVGIIASCFRLFKD